MDDSHRFSATGDATGARSDREIVSGMPRWAKVAVTVAIVLVVLVVAATVMMILGAGGPHELFRNLHSGGD